MSYDKVAVILPNSVILVNPEMTYDHYVKKIYDKVVMGEVLLFESESGSSIIYIPEKGLPISILTEKRFNEIRREQMLQQSSLIQRQ